MQMGISLTKDTRGSQSTVHAAAEIQMSSCLLRTPNWLLIGCMVILSTSSCGKNGCPGSNNLKKLFQLTYTYTFPSCISVASCAS